MITNTSSLCDQVHSGNQMFKPVGHLPDVVVQHQAVLSVVEGQHNSLPQVLLVILTPSGQWENDDTWRGVIREI